MLIPITVQCSFLFCVNRFQFVLSIWLMSQQPTQPLRHVNLCYFQTSFFKPVIFVTFFFPCRQILGFYSWGRTTNGIVVTIANDIDANDGDGNGRSASPLAQHWLFFHGTAWKHCHLFLRVKTDNGRRKKLIQDWWNVINEGTVILSRNKAKLHTAFQCQSYSLCLRKNK